MLIVDDEPAIRWVLAEALRGWDYETVEAETGAATLAALVTERPAAALLDINLPDISGLDLLREIKRRSPQTAVIMITAETLYENAVALPIEGFHLSPQSGGGAARSMERRCRRGVRRSSRRTVAAF